MAQNIIAVFIPIVITLVAGLVIVTAIYLKSREKQMLIEKGLDAQSIKEFFEGKNSKKDPYIWMKLGIICIGFGMGLGLGMYLQEATGMEFWVPFLLFTFTGIGFVVANISSRKLLGKEKGSL